MAQTRKRHSAEFKRKIALEALKGEKTVNELTSEHRVPRNNQEWRRVLLAIA